MLAVAASIGRVVERFGAGLGERDDRLVLDMQWLSLALEPYLMLLLHLVDLTLLLLHNLRQLKLVLEL